MKTIYVQIVAVRDVDIRPPRTSEWKNKKGKKLTAVELHSTQFFMGTEEQRNDWENKAAEVLMSDDILPGLFQSGAAIEVPDRNNAFMGMKNVRTMINSNGSITFQTSLFPTGVPG